ncbi:MAG TPA: hypothetical protein VGH06_03705, partial [Candidatus Udaeobacter sp.]
EPKTLSFAQGIAQFHDAELFAGGSQNDPDFAGANPTVYTNLWLQIRSKLLTGEAGVRCVTVIPSIAIPGISIRVCRGTLTLPRMRFTATKCSH